MFYRDIEHFKILSNAVKIITGLCVILKIMKKDRLQKLKLFSCGSPLIPQAPGGKGLTLEPGACV